MGMNNIKKAWSWVIQRFGNVGILLIDVIIVFFITLLVSWFWFFYSDFISPLTVKNTTTNSQISPGWKMLHAGNGTPSNSFYQLIEASNGDIWARTGAGLCQFKANTNTWICYEEFNKKLFYKERFGLTIDENGQVWATIWVGPTKEFGLWKLIGDRFVKVCGGSFQEICPASGGGVWTYNRFAGRYLVKYRDRETKISIKDFFDGILIQDKKNTLWLFESDWIGKLKEESSPIAYYDDSILKSNDYPGVGNIEISDTNIFFNRVNKRKTYVWLEGEKWKEFDNIWESLQAYQDKLQANQANQGNQGNRPYNNSLWAVTLNGKILCINKKLENHGWEVIQQVSHLTPLEISWILTRKNGEIWIAAPGYGIYVCQSEDYL